MLTRAAFGSVMRAVVMMLMVFGDMVDPAPTERGLLKPSEPHASDGPLKSSEFLRQWFLTKTPDWTSARSVTPGLRTDRKPALDKRGQILKMISALEEVHRTINSTLSSRITFMTRASGRHSGKKNKLFSASDKAVVKPTTASPLSPDSASRASTDTVVPGRNSRKSHPPQTKKTNKRVCFWKYCSQN